VNQATLDLYEADSHEALENNLHQVIPEQSIRDIKKSLESIFSNQKYAEIETVNYTLSGKKLDILLRFTPAKEDNPCILVSTIDISHYKALVKENRRLAKLPEANPDTIIMMACKEKVKYINPAGKNALEENDLNTIFDILPDNFSKGTCFECQNEQEIKKQYTKNNKSYLMKIHPFPMERECMITISDITEYTHLQEEKKLLAKAFERNHQPLIMTNEKGLIIKVNSAVEKIYGYSPEELLGKNTNILNPGREVYEDLGYSEKDYEELFSSLWKSIRDPNIGKWEDVVINQTKDGSLKWVELMISTVFDEDMNIKNFIAMPVDISKK
jgi:PAS domain S-box-containing protein